MAISRAEVVGQYKTESRMGELYVASPGKFQGEPLYVVSLWDSVMESGQDEEVESDVSDESPISVFFIDANDRKEFPELRHIEVVTVWETSNGFVHHKDFPSKTAYEKAKRNHEAELERDHPDEDDDEGDDEDVGDHACDCCDETMLRHGRRLCDACEKAGCEENSEGIYDDCQRGVTG